MAVLTIDKDGKVTDCLVGASSGSTMFDATACALLKVRGQFRPARDGNGSNIGSLYTQRVKWLMHDNGNALPGEPQVVAAVVDIDDKGLVRSCEVIEGAREISEGMATPCVRFPVGAKIRAALDKEGKPIGYRMKLRYSTEFERIP